MVDNKLYPWQINDFTKLRQLIDKLPSAILLLGQNNIGVEVLASNFIASVLCNLKTTSDPLLCECNSCVLLRESSHPDLFYLTPDISEAKTKNITIKNVREAIEFVSLTPHLSPYKVVFIEDVTQLTQNSANGLLKVLEEPPKYVIFVLISNNIGDMLPTLISRCYKYKLLSPSYDEGLEYLEINKIDNMKFWLAYYQNCPLFEVEVTLEQLGLLTAVLIKPSVDNIFNASQVFNGKTISFEFIITFLSKWVSDLATLSSGGSLHYFSDYKDLIAPLLSKIQLNKLFYFYDKLNFLSEWVNHPLNYQSQTENLLFQYQQVFQI